MQQRRHRAMPHAVVALLTLIGCCPVARCSRSSYLFISSPGEKTIHYSRLPTAAEMSRGEGMKPGTLVQGGLLVEPSGLAVDSSRGLLYVADPGAKAVFVIKVFEEGHGLRFDPKVAIDGAPQVLLSGVVSNWVAVDDTGAVLCSVSNGNKIWRVPGHIAVAVADGEEGPQAVGSSSSSALQLFSGSTPAMVFVQGITTAGGRAYWANGANGDTMGTVASGVIDEGDEKRSLTGLAQARAEAAASGICVSNSRIFYTDGKTSLFSVPFSGGEAPSSTISSALQEARGCTYDGDGTIFVADAKAGKVYDVSAGSAVSVNAVTGQRPLEVAVDGVPGSYGLAVMVAAAYRVSNTFATVIIVFAAVVATAS